MAKKKVTKIIKLQIPAGKANPAPPIGPALGSAGVNIMAFCKEFNDRTKDKSDILPVIITVYQDRSFTFETLEPPVSKLILKAAGITAGSKVPNRDKVGKLSLDQVRDIAKQKIQDMRAATVEAAMEMVKGTARSMGVEIEG